MQKQFKRNSKQTKQTLIAQKKKCIQEETVEQLTDDQIKAIDLQTGSIEQRNLKTTLKANGKLMLPPQNQAKVSLLVGGLVKTINVTEGVFVSQGQTLATIENNDINPVATRLFRKQIATKISYKPN